MIFNYKHCKNMKAIWTKITGEQKIERQKPKQINNEKIRTQKLKISPDL